LKTILTPHGVKRCSAVTQVVRSIKWVKFALSNTVLLRRVSWLQFALLKLEKIDVSENKQSASLCAHTGANSSVAHETQKHAPLE